MTFTPLPALTRRDAADSVLAAKRRLGLTWGAIARGVDRSPEWTASALLGQQPLTDEQAAAVGSVLDLDAAAVEALRLPPVRGADAVDAGDPLVHRLREAVRVYGPAIGELIREELGDGVMNPTGFSLSVQPAPGRITLTLNGEFLPYRAW